MTDASANYRGILAMIASSASFAANDACTKIAALYLPSSEIMAIRGLFMIVLVLAIIVARGEFARIRLAADRIVMLRALAETFTGFAIIIALGLMPIANVISILMVQPFLLTVLAVLVFKETVGWRRWTAVLAGFFGMLLIVKPATDAFEAASMIALFAALTALSRDLLTRRIGADVPTTVVTLASAGMGVVVGLAGASVEPWRAPNFYLLAICALAAAFLVLAFIFILIAFRGTDMSAVAPFRYAIVVFAVILGVIFFKEIPDSFSLIGMGLIVAAGIYMLHREAMLRRQTRAPKAVPAEDRIAAAQINKSPGA